MESNNNTSWQYKSSTGATATKMAPAAPVPPPAKAAGGGSAASVSWTASEYIDHQRGPGWYLLLIVATVIIAVLIYVLFKDKFATGTILIVGLLVGIIARRPPRQLAYQLSAEGLQVGEKLFPYNHFKSFSIVRDGALNSIQLEPIKKLMPPVSVYYPPADEEKIVDIISTHLPFEERQLDAVDRLSRRLRF